MKKFLLLSILIGLKVFCQPQHLNAQPPPTKQIPVTDTYFGKQVTDNYRWMENMNDSQVQQWFKAQGGYTDSIMNRISGRAGLINDWQALDKLKPEERSNFSMHNNRYFYLLEKPEEKVGKLYYRQGKTGNDILLFDPANYPGEKGKTYSIPYFVVNNQGDKVAIGISQGGAEVATIRVLNVDTKKFYPESIYPSWFGVTSWTPDGNFFLYNLQKTGDQNSPDFILDTKTMLHKVSTDSKTDKEILSREKYPAFGIKREDLVLAGFFEDQKYIYGELGGVQNELNMFYAPASELNNDKIQWKRLLNANDDVTKCFIYNDKLYLLSHKNASNYKLLVTDLNHPDVAHAKVVIPEGKEKIEQAYQSKDYLFLTMTNGITTGLLQYDLKSGTKNTIALPQRANSGITVYNPQSNEALISSTNWNLPNTFYDYNGSTKQLSKSVFQNDVKYPGLENIEVKEVEVPGYDGTMIPLSLIYRKDLKLDGTTPCILYGYGAYGISITPHFQIEGKVFLYTVVNKGVVFAIAHIRGGGEKGEAWHVGGYKTTKPNTWKDFISCAEYLEKEGYTSSQKLGCEGGSAGGILIGRAITERPDLFAAASCEVGVANVLRNEKTSNGPGNTPEFGISTDSTEAMALMEMDALSHVKNGVKYPAVLCTTGINDPRVAPWQPGKFAAALQNASSSGKPVLLRVDYDNGHFTDDKIVTYKEFADEWGFLLWQCRHPDFQMK